jgi:hypothetical protein
MWVLRAEAHDYFGGRFCELKLTSSLAGGTVGWWVLNLGWGDMIWGWVA